MALWEYNACLRGFEQSQKRETANLILAGYYCGYYVNGGKHAKNPNELIRRIFAKSQSLEEGLREIERIKQIEQGGKNHGG